MADEHGAEPEGVARVGRSVLQVRAGKAGWIVALLVLLGTVWLVLSAFYLVVSHGFGGGVDAEEITTWVTVARVLLVASIACGVLAVIGRRWALLPLSVLIALGLLWLNLGRWNVDALT